MSKHRQSDGAVRASLPVTALSNMSRLGHGRVSNKRVVLRHALSLLTSESVTSGVSQAMAAAALCMKSGGAAS